MTDELFRRRRAIEMHTPRDNRFQPHTPLGEGAEFDAIRRMLERWGPRARRIGDDAAVITALGDRALIVSTDTSVENVHFRKEWLSAEEIGYRAAAAALSDLAAMGAKPLGMLSSIALPESWRASLDALGDGIGDASAMMDAPILGGDLSRGSELSLTFTVLGTARDILYRSGARPGDNVYVTGTLGGSMAALTALQRGEAPPHRERFARPLPRVKEAAWLAEQGAGSAIDISDGLAYDLVHLAAASRVCINIDLGLVPRVEGVSAIDAARSGEEYEIVATSPFAFDTGAFASQFGIPLTRIGTVEQGTVQLKFVLEGEPITVPRGYVHFDA